VNSLSKHHVEAQIDGFSSSPLRFAMTASKRLQGNRSKMFQSDLRASEPLRIEAFLHPEFWPICHLTI